MRLWEKIALTIAAIFAGMMLVSMGVLMANSALEETASHMGEHAAQVGDCPRARWWASWTTWNYQRAAVDALCPAKKGTP